MLRLTTECNQSVKHCYHVNKQNKNNSRLIIWLIDQLKKENPEPLKHS